MPNVTYCQNAQFFFRWYDLAKPKDVIVYFTGELAAAIELAPNEEIRGYLLDIKEILWHYAVEGKLYLFQRKIDHAKYEYMAVKSSRKIHQLNPSHYYTRYSIDKALTRVNKLRQEVKDG